MDVEEYISRIIGFIDTYYKDKLTQNIRKDHKRLTVSDSVLMKYDNELADAFFDDPEEFIKAGEVAIESFDNLGNVNGFKFRVKVKDNSVKQRIRDIRAAHIGKLIKIEGIIRSKSGVRPNMSSVKYECPNCNHTLNVLQTEENIKEPTHCVCGRKGKFKIVDKTLVDGYAIMVEEVPEHVKYGTQLSKLNVLLKNDLCDSNIEERAYQGVRVIVTGMLKEVFITTRAGQKKTRLDFYLDANYIEILDNTSLDIKLKEADLASIKDYIAKGDVIKNLSKGIFNGVHGLDREKEALLLAIAEGTTNMCTSPITRGKIHVLFIGDPGQGKTTLQQALAPYLLKFRRVSGKGASGVGLIGATIRDELVGGWCFDAGALALADGGQAFVDELDKISGEDQEMLHQPMEELMIDIDKANIHTNLMARTTVISGANPKGHRFDQYADIYPQLDFKPTLLNRFDLIFVLKQGRDEAAIELEKQKAKTQIDRREVEVDEDFQFFVKKVWSFVVPLKTELTVEAKKYIPERFKALLSAGLKSEKPFLPITQRQVGGIIRIAEAHAKLTKAHREEGGKVKVDEADVDYAFELIRYSFQQISSDEATGQVDMDRVMTGISLSERSYMSVIKEIVKTLEEKIGKDIPMDDIVKVARESKIDEDKVEEVISRLKKVGELFEPRAGVIRRL